VIPETLFLPRVVALLVLAWLSTPTSARAEEPFAHIVPLTEHASGQYYVHGTLSGGFETEFLVDTGSGYVALSKETFARIRRQPGTAYVREIVGAMANGKLVKVPIYQIEEIAIGEACRLRDVEVAVFPSGARDILGLNALRRLEPFAMQLSPPQLWLSECRGQRS
jgi:clan AA aspartic protease (TIGR02281 family)